jgi:L-ribulokinase
MKGAAVIGVDFGTDTIRTVIVNAVDGAEISGSQKPYPRWQEGRYCDPARNQFRQHPLDYIESFEASVKEALTAAPAGTSERIAGIGIDTTGSTPVAVDRQGVPLSLTPGFEENPNAMFVLWKDHTAVAEAGEINKAAKNWGGEDFTRYEGGVYSSEWFWSKILHVLRQDEAVRKAAFSWVEHCDWFPALLTGNTNPLTLKRSRCAAGHKAMWHPSWGGLPSEDFLARLDPHLKGIRDRLYRDTYTVDVSAGTLCAEWAGRLGIRSNPQIAVGAFDAHLGAVGAEIEPFILCKVMGTSTCDMLIAPFDEKNSKPVRGICGQVDGSIVPGFLGMEAGQSAFGDVYAWFRDVLMYPVDTFVRESNLDANAKETLIGAISSSMVGRLSEDAARLPIDDSGIVALDWMNGRRTPDANQLLKGAISGLSLGTDAPRIFKALVEATAFGARMIVDRFKSEGVPIHGVIGLGGVAKKNPYVMQVVTDVLDMPMRIARSEQTVALGSAMAAATVAGIYKDIRQAQKAMGGGFEKTYNPDPSRAAKNRKLYERYKKLGGFIETQLT